MAKLYFRYGAMNSGKSTALLQVAHNYQEREQHVLLMKPANDTKGDTSIVSRLGFAQDVDVLIHPKDDLFSLIDTAKKRGDSDLKPVSCVLIDEAQFLTREHVNQLFRVAVLLDVPVLAYGIRTDFRSIVFPGSARLLEIAHSLEELKTICRCGKKAILNARKFGDVFVFEGEQLAIDGKQSKRDDTLVRYESLCGSCYLEASHGVLGEDKIDASSEPFSVVIDDHESRIL